MKRPRIVETENGFEPAFWEEARQVKINGEYTMMEAGWVVEPGFAKPTYEEAERMLAQDEADAMRVDAASAAYQSGYSYAAGYPD